MTPYEIGRGEIGQKEIAGSADNPRIVEYHQATSLKATNDETPWCSAFVNWCYKQAGIKGTNSAAARSWLNWGKELKQPVEGCVVVLKRGAPPSGHVGFFVRQEGNLIYVLGGNQSDQVKVSAYKATDVLSYRQSA